MATGTIKWYSKEKGFGFITPDEGGRDIYFQSTNIETEEEFRDGHRIEFELVMGRKGPEAIHIKHL